MAFFGVIRLVAALISLVSGISIAMEFYDLVPRLPTAVFAVGAMLAALLSFFAGLILDTVTMGRREFKRLTCLMQPAPTDRT